MTVPDVARQPRENARFGPRRPAKSEGLGLLFDALSGTAAVARLFGRDPSTVSKWRTGALPLPAEIAAALSEEAIRAVILLQAEAARLRADEIEAERRAADGMTRRRRAFLKLLNAGHP